MSSLSRRQWLGLIVLAVCAAAVVAMRLLITRDPIEKVVSLEWPSPEYGYLRWNAIWIGASVGCGLAVCGVFLQALLRNPLAEPFILGLSSGAGLGVMVAMYAVHVSGLDAWLFPPRGIAASVGALTALAIVYTLGQRRGVLDPVSLVLVGVIVSAICGAGIMFFQHLVPNGLRGEFTLWLMGNIKESLDARMIQIVAAFTGFGLVVGVLMGRAMDAATLSDDEARSVGLSIGPLRLALFVLAGLIAAMTVAVAGPIAFVGLIAPHAARVVLGPRHGVLVVGAALAGIALVVGSDVARQALDFGGGRMPIGVFTAIIGGPAFIWLLLSGRGQA